MQKLRRFLKFLKEPAFLFFVGVGNLILVTAVLAVFLLEKNVNPAMGGFFDALWWGVTTITTVGYGDVVPVTAAARVIGIILMYLGTVLFVAFTSLVATYWVRSEVAREITPLEKELQEEEAVTSRIEKSLRDIRERLKRLEERR